MSTFRQTKRSAFVLGHGNDEGEPVTGSSKARKVFRRLTLVFFCAMAVSPLQAQTFDWVRSGGGTLEDRGLAIAVDASGNSYVTGQFKGTATFGAFPLTSAGSVDIFVAKYDSSGNVLWARSAGGPNLENGLGIAVDASGNSYVTGRFRGTATFGTIPLTSAGDSVDIDSFVAKYDSSGIVLWARSDGGAGEEIGTGIAVDGSGNSHATGGFRYTASFGTIPLTSAGSKEVYVAKYDSGGNVLWARSAGGTGYDQGTAIAVDASGDSYVTGQFTGTAMFGPFPLTSAGSIDVFVAKYDSSGNVLWVESAGGIFDDNGSGVAVDTFGNSYVTGNYQGTATFGTIPLTSAGGFGEVFVAKYDSSGNVLWARSAGGPEQDTPGGIAVDASGNSHVTGIFEGTATFGTFPLTSAGSRDIFVAKYDSAGSFLWAEAAGGTGSDLGGLGIAMDASGKIYVIGGFAGTATFGTFPLTSAGSGDIFVAKLSDAPAGGTCSPDSDGDGIEDVLDTSDGFASNQWRDDSTTPVPFSGTITRFGADMTVCDLPSPNGVEIKNLTGPGAVAQSWCPTESMKVRTLGAGKKTQFDCLTTARAARSAPIAQATAVIGDVEVDLINLGFTIASLSLPEGNAIRYTQDTLQVSAPATNTVPLTIRNGPRQDELAPGESMTIVDDVNVPAVSQWSLLILALALLTGVTFKAARRRTVQA